MNDCKLHSVDFTDADCSDAYFAQSDLYRSIFYNTNLTRADFNHASSYAIDVNENRIKGARFSLPEAISLLDGLGITLVN